MANLPSKARLGTLSNFKQYNGHITLMTIQLGGEYYAYDWNLGGSLKDFSEDTFFNLQNWLGIPESRNENKKPLILVNVVTACPFRAKFEIAADNNTQCTVSMQDIRPASGIIDSREAHYIVGTVPLQQRIENIPVGLMNHKILDLKQILLDLEKERIAKRFQSCAEAVEVPMS